MSKRRYEILLPAEFNDGRLVADACPQCVPDSMTSAVDSFGAFTFRPDAAVGAWTADGRRYDDRLYVLVVDVADTAEPGTGSAVSSPTCCSGFEQLEIYVTGYPVEVH
jgi:hypothetical protein